MLERADAVFADGVSHRAEHTDRREPHDQAHRAEQHSGHRVDERSDALALFAADQREADAEDDREE